MPKTSHTSIEYQNLLTDAVKLRLARTPYSEIIETLGHWNSEQACQKAVAGYLKRNQIKVIEDSRAEAIAALDDLIIELKAKFLKNKSVIVAREIRNLLREINLLQGNYAPTKIAETDKDGNDAPKPAANLDKLTTEELFKLKEIQDKLKNG